MINIPSVETRDMCKNSSSAFMLMPSYKSLVYFLPVDVTWAFNTYKHTNMKLAYHLTSDLLTYYGMMEFIKKVFRRTIKNPTFSSS